MTEASPLPMSQPISVAELLVDPAGVPRARAMLQRAEWAARAFARYDKASVDAIVRAAAAAGAAKAREYAEWAVRETGFGVAEHKVLKNIACSTGIDQPGRYRVLQVPARADDPLRGGGEPAPASQGSLRRRRPDAGRCSREGGRP
jgi:hypothetical protein